MSMRYIDGTDGTRLAVYEEGNPDGPTVVLVHGWPDSHVLWDGVVPLLADKFRVIRYDNRDIGRSTRLDGHPPPTLWQLARRDRRAVAYTLADMAAGGIGLLDNLGIERGHVVGASMGGMIAQTMAIRFPDRVRSLASIMSNTGARFSGQPALGVYGVLLGRRPTDREAAIERGMRTFAKIGSPGFDRDELELRDVVERSYDRGHDPAGPGRQLAAIVAAPDRTRELRRLAVPTVVIHGTRDRLVKPSGGRATARAIPGARLVRIEGMGHDLPRGAWPRIVGAIADNAARAGVAAARRSAA